ncbi:hypothetical protein Tco_1103626 [Tanacetum coccineum]
MTGYKHNQLKSKNYDEIQKLFDKAMTRVNISKRAGDELEQEKAKKQKIDDDQEEVEIRKLIEKHLEEKRVTRARFGKKLDKNKTFKAGDFHPDAFTKSALKVVF